MIKMQAGKQRNGVGDSKGLFTCKNPQSLQNTAFQMLSEISNNKLQPPAPTLYGEWERSSCFCLWKTMLQKL